MVIRNNVHTADKNLRRHITKYTKQALIDFLREQRERALNMQAVVTGGKSEHLLDYYQENIDKFNDIIELISANEFNDYQQKALRTANKLTKTQMIFNGVLGLNGEAGEIADLLKKHLFQGHELDEKKMAMELGDVLWYIAILANGLGFNLNEVASMNITKLEWRYPNGFDPDRSKNREGEKT